MCQENFELWPMISQVPDRGECAVLIRQRGSTRLNWTKLLRKSPEETRGANGLACDRDHVNYRPPKRCAPCRSRSTPLEFPSQSRDHTTRCSVRIADRVLLSSDVSKHDWLCRETALCEQDHETYTLSPSLATP